MPCVVQQVAAAAVVKSTYCNLYTLQKSCSVRTCYIACILSTCATVCIL